MDMKDPGSSGERHDVLIVGAGMVGLTAGCALAGAGFSVAVIDKQAPDESLSPAYDGRASAIAQGSAQVFRGIGVWDRLDHAAEPILDIRVADGHPHRGVSPLFLHYDHRDVGDAPFGYIIENREIRHALAAQARTLPSLTVYAPESIERLDRNGYPVVASLEDGRRISADLAIAADGRFSRMREWAGIRTSQLRYDQVSIVCTVHHARGHDGVAVELFLPGGPFAMLPMTEDRSNVVWSERTALAGRYLALDDQAFLEELRLRFGDWLGEITLVGPRFSYPLGLLHAASYVDDRLILAGDAAHAIHPIAGQGLNLGLRDVAALAEVLVDARRLGLDVGGAATLARYERWRRFDNAMLAAVTDGLNRLFSNDIAPVRLVRDVGLAAVDRLPPVKRFLMRHAMGLVGDLPRLVRGEPL